MNDNDKATFEPFITVTLGAMRQAYGNLTTKIAVSSNAPGVTAIHWYDAPAARRLVDELNKLIAVLDPSIMATASPAGPQKKLRKPQRVPVKRARKAKKGKRK
jgi:hypothetical protein